MLDQSNLALFLQNYPVDSSKGGFYTLVFIIGKVELLQLSTFQNTSLAHKSLIVHLLFENLGGDNMCESNQDTSTTAIMDRVKDKMDRISIFISHKSKDRKTAEEIIKVLKKNDNQDNPKITFFISYDIPGGDRWYETIRKNLKESNLLLLLFTDSTRNWDWCLYEAGLFDPLDDDTFKRVICLHNTSSIPGPLKHLQGFSATTENMKKFLYQLFVLGATRACSLRSPGKWAKCPKPPQLGQGVPNNS